MKYSDLLVFVAICSVLCSGYSSDVSSDVSQTASATGSGNDGSDEPARVDFAGEVLPIFERSCYPCHGPKMSPMSSAGFRVDLREQAVGRGNIVPGQPDESPLIKRLTTKEDSKRMPPVKADNPQLTSEQVDLLKRWIKEGANY